MRTSLVFAELCRIFFWIRKCWTDGRYNHKDDLKKLMNLQNELRANESAADKMANNCLLNTYAFAIRLGVDILLF